MRQWRIIRGGITVNGTTTVSMAVEIRDGETFSGEQTDLAIERIEYDTVRRQLDIALNHIKILEARNASIN